MFHDIIWMVQKVFVECFQTQKQNHNHKWWTPMKALEVPKKNINVKKVAKRIPYLTQKKFQINNVQKLLIFLWNIEVHAKLVVHCAQGLIHSHNHLPDPF